MGLNEAEGNDVLHTGGVKSRLVDGIHNHWRKEESGVSNSAEAREVQRI
jgi:hypothetical protein